MSAIALTDDHLWIRHIEKLIELWSVNRPTDFCILSRIKSLSIGTLKKALTRVELSRCLEKPDFQRMLMCRLAFGERSVGSHDPFIYYPDWAMNIGAFVIRSLSSWLLYKPIISTLMIHNSPVILL